MQHVLSTTTSASCSPCARTRPSASSSPAMRSESCSFIWHPKVRTMYRRALTTPQGRGHGPDPGSRFRASACRRPTPAWPPKARASLQVDGLVVGGGERLVVADEPGLAPHPFGDLHHDLGVV